MNLLPSSLIPTYIRWCRYSGGCAALDASPVCAVRRVVVSLLEAGGMREEIPGLSVYLEVKAEGDKSRLRKRCILEGVVE